MRHLAPIDDVLGPLVKVLTAVVLCYLPMFGILTLSMLAPGPLRFLALPCMVAGAMAFPAVLLTVVTSGSLANLRPDRLVKVAREGGPRYVGLAALWFVLFPVYLWAFLGVNPIVDIVAPDVTGAGCGQDDRRPAAERGGRLLRPLLLLAVGAAVPGRARPVRVGVGQELERERAERRR